MALEFELYTGKLKFKDIEFTFVFDKKELRLIPPNVKVNFTVTWESGIQNLNFGWIEKINFKLK